MAWGVHFFGGGVVYGDGRENPKWFPYAEERAEYNFERLKRELAGIKDGEEMPWPREFE